MEKLNVAIADDNERMLNLLGEIVESDKDLKLVGKARKTNSRMSYCLT